ncbi:hypothetical protein ACQ4PT_064304 [Festuca glaucescens]
MAHIIHQLLETTRSHPYHPSATNIGASSSMAAPHRTRSAPLHIDDLLWPPVRGPLLQQPSRSSFENPTVVFPEAGRDNNHDLESFANDLEGNVGGGFSPGAHDGVYSEDGGYKAPVPEEDGNHTDNAFDGLHGEEAKIQFDDIDDDVSSQPAVPFVGMLFDHPDDAHKFYNEYAFKKGFGTRIAASRNNQRRGPPILIKRVFECVHPRKTVDNTKSECTSESIASESTSGSKQGGVAMEVTDSRQRNRLLRHDCQAHMIVALREGRWKVTYFVEEHTHEMLQHQERTRYYMSHRNVPEEDYQMIVALHNHNITTYDIMGILADEHGGNPRTLPYVKRDVTNLRAKLWGGDDIPRHGTHNGVFSQDTS